MNEEKLLCLLGYRRPLRQPEFRLITGFAGAWSARIPIFRLKTCLPLFEIHTDSTGLAKMTAKPVAGLRPNVACEFKRAGFLEWRNDWNITADRLKASNDS